jgi:porphobilinogen synthase
MTTYPQTRLRRNRINPWIREIVAEHDFKVSSMIQPFFVIEGEDIAQAIISMPGIYRYSIDLLVTQAKIAQDLGIQAIMLFPSIKSSLKTLDARESFNENNLICRAVIELKKHLNIGIIADIALDPYTSHGHDGIIIDDYVDNDLTIEVLCKQSLALAKAGCDMIAPSDMMDGRIGKIRNYLDERGYKNLLIMSYAAKYASNFYGPFRDAVSSNANLAGSSKSSYQMDFRNSKEAMREIELDIKEGADLIIIKPAIAYLDIIYQAHCNFNIPIIAYQVSGEYSMLKAASINKWLDFNKVMMESLMAIRRAGASSIITYAAMEIALYEKN